MQALSCGREGLNIVQSPLRGTAHTGSEDFRLREWAIEFSCISPRLDYKETQLMTPYKFFLKGLLTIQAMALLVNAPQLPAQDKPARSFNEVADQALSAMKKRADELNIKGVALVSYAEGDTVKGWSSKMLVVGNLTSGSG